MSNEPLWSVGQRVHVFFDLADHSTPAEIKADDKTLYIKDGVIDKIQAEGPYEEQPFRCIRVRLDDQTLAGGTGLVWVAEEQLTTA